MFNNFVLKYFGVLLFSYCCTATFAATMQKDSLHDLIEQFTSPQTADVNTGINRAMVGRASWHIQCEFQAQDKTKVCFMQKHHITVMRLNDDYSINIGSNHLKNSISSLRVDQNNVVQAREGLYRDAGSIIEQFRTGSVVKTRFQSDINHATQYHEQSLLGFADAFEDMQVQYQSLNDSTIQYAAF